MGRLFTAVLYVISQMFNNLHMWSLELMLGQLIKPTRDDKHRKVDLRPLCNPNDPASSVDTSISHNESTYPPKATWASDVIADKNIKENTQVTEEERKRDRKKALRRAAYRQRKDRNLQDEHAQALILSANPTSSNYTSFSFDATAFHATTTVTSGLINDMEVQDVVLNNTQETKQKTDEELKRDRRNALRRAAYRRKKDKLIHDENIRPLLLSGCINLGPGEDWFREQASFCSILRTLVGLRVVDL